MSCEHLREKCRAPRSGRTLRKPAVEMHMDISQEQFHARICRKNGAPQDRDVKLGAGRRSRRACTWNRVLQLPFGTFPPAGPKLEAPNKLQWRCCQRLTPGPLLEEGLAAPGH